MRFHTLDDLQETMGEIVDAREYEGEAVDYLDGVVFSARESYLVLGRTTDEPGPLSDYTGREIYYRSIQHDHPRPTRDTLSTLDYLWRWDTDWFWCSRAFGAQNPKIRRLWPKKLLRSSFYWKLIGYDQRFDIADRLNKRKGLPANERVVQDIEVPIENTTAYLEWFLENIPIEPVWLCPLRLREPALAVADAARPWPLYPLEPGRTYVNVGFWSSVPQRPGEPDAHNRRIERLVTDLDGHKSLYSEAFYPRDVFDRLYGGANLAAVQQRYDPAGRLTDLYDKVVRTP